MQKVRAIEEGNEESTRKCCEEVEGVTYGLGEGVCTTKRLKDQRSQTLELDVCFLAITNKRL